MDIKDFDYLQKELKGKTVIVKMQDVELTGLWIRTVLNDITTECAVVLKTDRGELRLLVNRIESIKLNYES